MRFHCRYYDAPVADVLSGKVDLDEVRKDCGVVSVGGDDPEFRKLCASDEAFPVADVDFRFAAMKVVEVAPVGGPYDPVFCGLVEPGEKWEVVVEVAPVGGPYEPTVLVANCYKVVFDADGKKFVVDPAAYKRFVVEKTVVVRRVARAV